MKLVLYLATCIGLGTFSGVAAVFGAKLWWDNYDIRSDTTTT